MNKTYKRGDRLHIKYITYDGDIVDEYLIVQVGFDCNKVCLIDTTNDKFWCNPMDVKDVEKISQKEMDNIIGGYAELITKKEYEKYLKE